MLDARAAAANKGSAHDLFHHSSILYSDYHSSILRNTQAAIIIRLHLFFILDYSNNMLLFTYLFVLFTIIDLFSYYYFIIVTY